MGLLELGSGKHHGLVGIGERANLVTRNLIDLHLVEGGNHAFPGSTFHRLDDDHRTGQVLVITDFLGLGLELVVGDFFPAPTILLGLYLVKNVFVAVVKDFTNTLEEGTLVSFKACHLDVG